MLSKAISDVEKGMINADLGGGLIKQRVARPGQGKSSGFRTLIVIRFRSQAFFVYGFAKNERDNISLKELAGYKKAASQLLAWSESMVEEAIASGGLVEIER